jgi:putative membrane protein
MGGMTSFRQERRSMYQGIRRGLLAVVMLGMVLAEASLGAAPPAEATAFVNTAAQAGLMEIQAANLARNVSTNEAVKTFAARMIADHGKIHAELAALAKSKQIPIPSTLDTEHAGLVESLRARSGSAFDAAYAQQMVDDHGKALELFQANVSQPDGELAAFAGKTLVVLQEHKRLADNLNANLKK